jgi:cell shape-determining protein MreC
MNDILETLRYQDLAPKALHTIEQCREKLADAIWYAANEIERLRNENKELKDKLKQYE